MFINPKAISKLSGIIFSCILKKDGRIDPGKIKFIKNAKNEGGIDFREFVKKIPLLEETCQELEFFSKDVLGKKEIDSEAVCAFFGGNPHLDYSIKNIKENGLGGDFFHLFLISHILLPVKVTKKGEAIFGEYVNGDLRVRFENLNLAKNHFKVHDGQIVLVHYGFIVADSISLSNTEMLLEIQRQREEFVKACQAINNVDCKKLLQFFRLISKGSRVLNCG
ncbi:MAG TPA: hypothetical protein PLK35_01775 [Candidatus Moranbacteria bacterium]|nr:hypothetical protein [Candidatus Moranbacteria bacterium]